MSQVSVFKCLIFDSVCVCVCEFGSSVRFQFQREKDPKIARTTVCEIRFSAPKIQINAVQRFNLTDDGAFILFARVEGRGIELKQRHDDRFGVVEVVTERIERVQGPRRGFIVDHRSGRVIMAGESTPWTRPDAVVKQTGTTITRETVTTNTKDNTVSRKVTTENVPTESPAQTSSDGGGNEDDWAAQLEKLADLKAKGILTEDEFQQAKKRLLGL